MTVTLCLSYFPQLFKKYSVVYLKLVFFICIAFPGLGVRSIKTKLGFSKNYFARKSVEKTLIHKNIRQEGLQNTMLLYYLESSLAYRDFQTHKSVSLSWFNYSFTSSKSSKLKDYH